MNYNKVEFYCSYGTYAQLPPPERPEIVFAGHSNVGKSSLINKLFNRKNLARVSATPGKTATINSFSGDCFYFVDLPGYGYAKVSKAEQLKKIGLSVPQITELFLRLNQQGAELPDDIYTVPAAVEAIQKRIGGRQHVE